MEKIEENFNKIISDIKSDITNTRISTIQYVNKELIFLYFRIGKALEDNSKYGHLMELMLR